MCGNASDTTLGLPDVTNSCDSLNSTLNWQLAEPGPLATIGYRYKSVVECETIDETVNNSKSYWYTA